MPFFGRILPFFGRGNVLEDTDAEVVDAEVGGLHYSDLRIICISNNYYKNSSAKLSFITRDKGILDNKDILEKEFKSVLIKKVRDFVG